jgi:hypothetical protein
MKMVETLILAVIWIVSGALYKGLGLSARWAGILGLVTAVLCGGLVEHVLMLAKRKKRSDPDAKKTTTPTEKDAS